MDVRNAPRGGEQVATSVISAFKEFQRDSVNLDSDQTKIARASRDWLVDQIHSFPSSELTFPYLYSEYDIFFGSFARRTQIREIDDIDIMICLHAEGSSYVGDTTDIKVTVSQTASRLPALCDDGTRTLNSRKVINKFISQLSSVPQYKKADVGRNLEAATLELRSYTWNFDIVPCFITAPDVLGRTFYLIPDGYGNWKKTDPRKDRDRVSQVNQTQSGNVLDVIRITKYWNNRPTIPSIPSYLLETMIIDHYEGRSAASTSAFVDLEIPTVLQYIMNHIFAVVNDSKGIQGNINTVSTDDQKKIYVRAYLDHQKAVDARTLEQQHDEKGSIAKWTEFWTKLSSLRLKGQG